MAVNIKSSETDRLIRKLASLTGESITVAVNIAILDRLAKVERKRQNTEALLQELRAISHHCASLPTLDTRSEDGILGYDENGIPS
jgi:antitoxin VapB